MRLLSRVGYERSFDASWSTYFVRIPHGFEVDPFRKHCLVHGLDDIGLTLQHVNEIRDFESRRKRQAPWLFGPL